MSNEDDSRDGSSAPPTPVPARAQTGSMPAVSLTAEELAAAEFRAMVERMRTRSHRLVAENASLTARVLVLEALVGTLPTALHPGSGAMKLLTDINHELGELRSDLKADREATAKREKEREEAEAAREKTREKAREPWSKAAWIAIAAAISVIASGATNAALMRWQGVPAVAPAPATAPAGH